MPKVMSLSPPAARATTASRLPLAVTRGLPLAGVVLLAASAVAVWLAFPTYPNYDSQYGLLWGAELVEGRTPGFGDYRAPTEHPLMLALGALLAPLGADTGARAFVLVCFGALIALIVAMYRLGRLVAGPIGGLVAAALVASRLNFGLLAAIGFLDVPYCALIAWAATLEMERPRRGGPVWLLLALAGLLRPEAWLLAAAYGLRMAYGRELREWAAAAAAVAAAPLIWCATDYLVTGDALFSVHHTDALARELGRERPLTELPLLMVKLLLEAVKPPVLILGLVGAALGWRLRRRELAVPAALVVLTGMSYLVIAGGGLATVYRYLLVAALGLMALAAFAAAGWTTLEPGSALRRPWMVAAVLALVVGGAYTTARIHPSYAVAKLHERVKQRASLVAVLTDPATARALRCGPLTVPNHKLIPEVRTILGLPAGEVVARSDRSRPHQIGGVAIVVDKQIEYRASVNVWEVRADGLASVMAPAGFRPLATSPHFAAWGSCG